jgi:hypothetical protein
LGFAGKLRLAFDHWCSAKVVQALCLRISRRYVSMAQCQGSLCKLVEGINAEHWRRAVDRAAMGAPSDTDKPFTVELFLTVTGHNAGR